jgi:ribosome modulation factor
MAQHDALASANCEDQMKRLLIGTALAMAIALPAHAMSHNRRCDIVQDHPRNLNPEGGNANMFGLCNGSDAHDPDDGNVSRTGFWNAYNCGYQAYRQGKVSGANPYYNDELEQRWSQGWQAAKKACQTGKGPFDR